MAALGPLRTPASRPASETRTSAALSPASPRHSQESLVRGQPLEKILPQSLWCRAFYGSLGVLSRVVSGHKPDFVRVYAGFFLVVFDSLHFSKYGH